jgi:hypothetical protein
VRAGLNKSNRGRPRFSLCTQVKCLLETDKRIRATERRQIAEKWRAWRDSNPQPSDPKSEALSG